MIQLQNIAVQAKILDFIVKNEDVATKDLQKYLEDVSRPTLSRYLKELKETGLIEVVGENRATRYTISTTGIKAFQLNLELYDSPHQTPKLIYFKQDLFKKCTEFLTKEEIQQLEKTNNQYALWRESTEQKYKDLAYERCAIEFSWKSSKIEGNTYTLLETEQLIKNREEAKGRTHDEAVMILNQKNVFDLMYCKNTFSNISPATLIDVHALLVQDLGIPNGIRKSHVGITGTQYNPLMIQSQITEALERLFSLLSTITNPVEQAIVALASIAYIQPFVDGNKRTSRHFANLILHVHSLPPVAWRTVNEIEYKKAMIAFYELGNIRPIAEMWIRHYHETVAVFFK